ncbi:MAG: helix-turn-helix domain-containing protein [Mycobacteriaceae bacterium]
MRKSNSLRAALNPSSPSTPSTTPYVVSLGLVQQLRAAGLGTPEHAPELSNLTPQELRVALAAGQGRTNREIATTFYLSPKTVEYHLGKVYTKLGITSRGQLARVVASPSHG